MEENRFDVLIIGAGAAGLMAALEVALTGRTVTVIEAKERCGGRMNTVYTDAGYPIERGAEFVHGKLPVTLGLLKKAGVKTIPLGGSYWQHKNGELSAQNYQAEDDDDVEKKLSAVKEDIPVVQFLAEHLSGDKYKDRRLSLKRYVEGYYAGDVAKASTIALREELLKEEEAQYRIEGGYQKLIDYLEGRCREKGVQFFFSETVQEVRWRDNAVNVSTTKNEYRATRLIVTVSVGVLANNGLRFFPTLPEKRAAAQRLGFGHVVKIILEFDEPFWKDKTLTNGKDLSSLHFLFSEEAIPTWWTQYPKADAVLAGWLGGPNALAFEGLEKEAIEKKAIHALSSIFNLDVIHLSQKLRRSYFYNWQADPAFCGAYSYEVVGGEAAQKIILQPDADTVYFAGEGLHHGPEIGTVEAALQSGQTVARNVITSFQPRL